VTREAAVTREAGGVGPVLFLIPARGGSVRVPGKNLALVAGIPLVGRAVRAARLAAEIVPGGPHRIVCSTDDPAIAAAAEAWGAEVLVRPAELATADATSADVAIHALDALEHSGVAFRALVLVQPTSPLTEPADLAEAVRRFDETGGRRPVVGITASHPAGWHVTLEPGTGAIRRVDAPAAPHILSGSVYVVDPGRLGEARSFWADDAIGFELPPERSVDVDEPHDLVVAKALTAARPVRPVVIGARVIGNGSVFVIAEAGVNHNGDPALAHQLIDAAADAGADCVKFQTFDPDMLASAAAPTADYQRETAAGHDQRAMLRALALPTDAWAGLRDHARERGIVFLSSPFDEASADLLDALDVPAFKVPSGELTNLPFLARLARRGRPLLMSTGMADMVEVAAAMDAIAAAGDPPVALFHCVSAYPAPPADANLRAIETLRRAFAVPVGWSDHTPGIELALASVAAGALLVEKHLTLDRTMPGPDHQASLEPGELRAMVDGIRMMSAAMGDGVKRPVAAELPIAAVARKSLHWRVDLAAGAVIVEEDLVAMRPGTGMAPGRTGDVVGRRAVRTVVAGTAVLPGDLEPVS
jgi:N,N'-diacetyllegionaminate synthase